VLFFQLVLYRLKSIRAYRFCRIKIDGRVRQLSEVLMNELRVTPEKSLQGGPRAASRAVLLLTRLGQASQV